VFFFSWRVEPPSPPRAVFLGLFEQRGDGHVTSPLRKDSVVPVPISVSSDLPFDTIIYRLSSSHTIRHDLLPLLIAYVFIKSLFVADFQPKSQPISLFFTFALSISLKRLENKPTALHEANSRYNTQHPLKDRRRLHNKEILL
jgi:hypothetical protein